MEAVDSDDVRIDSTDADEQQQENRHYYDLDEDLVRQQDGLGNE
jgi:hypothetical protein